jgi:hypothetical protein
LNFSRAIETRIIEYIEENYAEIETDMNVPATAPSENTTTTRFYVNNPERPERSARSCLFLRASAL